MLSALWQAALIREITGTVLKSVCRKKRKLSCRQLKLEAVTELTNTADPQGFTENKKIAQRGGSITEDERNKYAQWNY